MDCSATADGQPEKSRSHSSSAIDDARVERERVFRLRADRPLHRPRDPWRMSAQVWNCFGIWNWTVLILIIVAVKMFLENINKYGLQVDPSLWGSLFFGQSGNTIRSELAIFILIIYMNVPIMVALKTEIYLAQSVIHWSTGLLIHSANILILLTMPVKFVYMMPHEIGLISSVLVVMMYTCLFMKLVSYIQVNKWCRESRLDNRCLPKRRYTFYKRSEYSVHSKDESKIQLRRRFYRKSPDIKDTPCLEEQQHPSVDAIVDLNNNNNKESAPIIDLNNNCEEVGKEKKAVAAPTTASDFRTQERTKVRRSPSKLEKVALRSPSKFEKVALRSPSKFEKMAAVDRDNDVDVNAPVKVDVVYPNNLTVSDLYYFCFLPTLCYEVNFPRTRRIRKLFLLHRAVEVFVCSNLCICIIQQYIVPSVVHTLLPFSNMEISLVTERLLKVALPNHLLWLLLFYLVFHSCLNTSAELLQFADRSFFRDWWNAPNLEVFWKTWNLPVHRWCVRHLYKPLLAAGFSRLSSMVVVFSLSALLHEYAVSVPLRMFNGRALLGMLAQIPLVDISRRVERRFGSKCGNMMVWTSLIIGQPLIILMYYHDYVIQHFGHQMETMRESCQC